jgi:hypothetical protein
MTFYRTRPQYSSAPPADRHSVIWHHYECLQTQEPLPGEFRSLAQAACGLFRAEPAGVRFRPLFLELAQKWFPAPTADWAVEVREVRARYLRDQMRDTSDPEWARTSRRYLLSELDSRAVLNGECFNLALLSTHNPPDLEEIHRACWCHFVSRHAVLAVTCSPDDDVLRNQPREVRSALAADLAAWTPNWPICGTEDDPDPEEGLVWDPAVMMEALPLLIHRLSGAWR